jgi:hypothetical protein
LFYQFTSLGYSPPDTLKLLVPPTVSDNLQFDTRSDLVHWMCNLEKDAHFSQYPSSLSIVLIFF